MLTRRRALLISAVTSGAKPDYSMEVVSSLVIHQSTSDTISTEWYVAKGFESDGTFTLTNPSKSMLSYSSTGTFNNLFLQRYCIQGASSGSTMYYFPAGCTATHTHDETAGTYTITVTGRIQVYTMNVLPFAFTYTGEYTDSRVDDVGDITFTTSGLLTVTSGTATVSVYMLAGGGGGAIWGKTSGASGGGGGYQTVIVTLDPGTYEVIIGAGGDKYATSQDGDTGTAGDGSSTSAFGYTCTGGKGAKAGPDNIRVAGAAGSPNASAGTTGIHDISASGLLKGGDPNGGGIYLQSAMDSSEVGTAYNGGDGLVRMTFS